MAVKKLLTRKLPPRTLRGRLIAGLVAVLAIGCATVGLVTYFAVERALSDELNTQLQTATQIAYNCWRTGFNSNADNDNGDGSQQLTNGPGGGQSPSPSSVPSGSKNGNASGATTHTQCTGLTEGTFVAVIKNGSPTCLLINEEAPKLSAADTRTLVSID